MSIDGLLASDTDRGADGSAGFSVHPELQAILDRTDGFIRDNEDGNRFRRLYQQGTLARCGSVYKKHK